MPVESIGTSLLNSTQDLTQTGLAQEDFLKIFLAQLSFQDPLEPVDNQQFMAQMAQFAALEQSSQLNDRIDALLTLQAANQSVGLIGKTVEVRTESGAEVGTVTTIQFINGEPSLTVQKANNQFVTGIGLSQILLVRQ